MRPVDGMATTAETPPGPLPPVAGALAVAWARRALAAALQGRRVAEAALAEEGPTSAVLDAPRGVFVTLRSFPDRQLRGCVGFPRASYPLRTAVARAAVAAGLDDPRFPPVGLEELDRLVVEVSLLTEPAPLDEARREEWPELIQVGRHGLIVEERNHGGLLLPQVAPEQGWDSREFLAGTCEKAGLPPGAWRRPGVRVLTFEALVFEEERPAAAARPRAG